MTTVIWNFVSPSSKSHRETGNVKELQTKQESNSYLHWYREIRAFPFWKGLSPEFPATLSSWGVSAEFDLSGMMAPSQLPVLSSGPFSISKEMLLVCSVPLPLTSQLIIYWETLNEHPFLDSRSNNAALQTAVSASFYIWLVKSCPHAAPAMSQTTQRFCEDIRSWKHTRNTTFHISKLTSLNNREQSDQEKHPDEDVWPPTPPLVHSNASI